MKLPLDSLDKLLHSLLEPVAIVTSARELTSAGPAVLWTQLPPAATSGHPADHPRKSPSSGSDRSGRRSCARRYALDCPSAEPILLQQHPHRVLGQSVAATSSFRPCIASPMCA